MLGRWVMMVESDDWSRPRRTSLIRHKTHDTRGAARQRDAPDILTHALHISDRHSFSMRWDLNAVFCAAYIYITSLRRPPDQKVPLSKPWVTATRNSNDATTWLLTLLNRMIYFFTVQVLLSLILVWFWIMKMRNCIPKQIKCTDFVFCFARPRNPWSILTHIRSYAVIF